jgi:hypothetical protein
MSVHGWPVTACRLCDNFVFASDDFRGYSKMWCICFGWSCRGLFGRKM